MIKNKSSAINKEIKNDEAQDIDKILYSIKQLNFDQKKVKEKLNLDFSIYKYYDKNNFIINLNGAPYHIFPEARKIQFIDGKKLIEKFVYSKINLEDVLKELEFKFFTFNTTDNSYDFIESEIGLKEIYDIFKDISINKITKINPLKNIIDKFRIRYSQKDKLISDLSLNASLYYPENKNDAINYKILNKYFDEFEKILCYDRNVTYLSGPKGTSKSLFLMNYTFEQNQLNKFPLLYINYKVLVKLTPNQKRNDLSFF